MAFSDAQKLNIRFYLGIGDLFHGSEANVDIDSRIELFGSRPETQTKIESLLAKLQTVEDGLDGLFDASASHGSLKRVEEIEFYNDAGGLFEDSDFRRIGRRLCNQLAIMFDTKVQRDVFGNGPRVFPWGMG